MPFLAGWNYRKEIRYGATIPASNLTNFPLLLKIIDDADIGAELSARKFAVTEADGETTVAYGHYNDFDVTGDECTFTLRALFDLDSGASEDDVLGYLYYDDAATDQSNRSGLADGAGYHTFWPNEEDPSGSAPQILDWSSNDYHLTSEGSMTSGDLVAGQVGSAIDFDGSDDDLIVTFDAAFSGEITMSCWFRPTLGARQVLMQMGVGGFQAGTLTLYEFNGGDSAKVDWSGGGDHEQWMFGPLGINDGQWNKFDVVRTGSSGDWTCVVYLNGSVVSTESGITIDPSSHSLAQTISIGADSFNVARYFSGPMDETSLSVPRSADWIAFTYANESNNAATVTLGAEEAAPAGDEYPFWSINSIQRKRRQSRRLAIA